MWEQYYSTKGCMRGRIGRFRQALQPKLPRGSIVLDFGCGSGDLSSSIGAAGYQVVGIDQAPNMILRATERLASERVTFQLLKESCGKAPLPFGDAVFDAVICSSVLEYMDCLEFWLREFGRICRPGGWLFATVPNMLHPKRSIEKIEIIVRSMLAGSDQHAGRLEYLTLSKNRFPLRRWLHLLGGAQWHAVRIEGRMKDLLLIAARHCEERAVWEDTDPSSSAQPLKVAR